MPNSRELKEASRVALGARRRPFLSHARRVHAAHAPFFNELILDLEHQVPFGILAHTLIALLADEAIVPAVPFTPAHVLVASADWNVDVLAYFVGEDGPDALLLRLIQFHFELRKTGRGCVSTADMCFGIACQRALFEKLGRVKGFT